MRSRASRTVGPKALPKLRRKAAELSGQLEGRPVPELCVGLKPVQSRRRKKRRELEHEHAAALHRRGPQLSEGTGPSNPGISFAIRQVSRAASRCETMGPGRASRQPQCHSMRGMVHAPGSRAVDPQSLSSFSGLCGTTGGCDAASSVEIRHRRVGSQPGACLHLRARFAAARLPVARGVGPTACVRSVLRGSLRVNAAGRDFPFFPTEQGKVVTKAAMTETILFAARWSRAPLANADRTLRVSGRSLRPTGAQGLAELGLDAWAIELLGRWGGAPPSGSTSAKLRSQLPRPGREQ